MIQDEKRLCINTPPENEAFVRLLMLEEVLELKDFLRGLESMKSPDMMGADLLMGMFGGEINKDS